MRWLRCLTALWSCALVACGESPRPGGEAASTPSPPASAAAEGASAGAPPGRQGTTPIEILAVVGGRELEARGPGECQHAAEGSIYQRPASLWSARFDGGDAEAIRHLNLTFWREAGGTEAFNLALGAGADAHRIATVEGGELHGSGTARLEGGPDAGTLVVEGTTADGIPVRVRARCERFTTMVAEGG